jgi:hypothetical protein
MSLLYLKEIRLYLPIQELNILLEPIKDKSKLFDEEYEKSGLCLFDLNTTSSSNISTSNGSLNDSDMVISSDSDQEPVNYSYDYDSNSSVEKLEFD